MTAVEVFGLLKVVKEMRRLQRLYWKSKSKTVLQQARVLESQVDAELGRLLPDEDEPQPKGLFD